MAILLSINPDHVNSILSGSKKFEYRTKIPKNKIDKILIYSTSPIKKIVAESKVTNILCLRPNDLWNKTKKFSGIDKSFFDKYFKNRNLSFAFELEKIKIFEKPKTLAHYGIKIAPQSFCYIK